MKGIIYACAWSSSLVISHWVSNLNFKGICINLHFLFRYSTSGSYSSLYFFFLNKSFYFTKSFFPFYICVDSTESQTTPPPPTKKLHWPWHSISDILTIIQPFSSLTLMAIWNYCPPPPPPNSYHSYQIQLHWTFLAQIINDCISHTVHWPLTLQFDLSSHCFLDIYTCVFIFISFKTNSITIQLFLHDRSYSEKWHILQIFSDLWPLGLTF